MRYTARSLVDTVLSRRQRDLRRSGSILGLAVVISLLATACSSTTATSNAVVTAPTATKPALFAELPAAIQKSGVILDGVDFTYAPLEFVKADGKTYTGIDFDLAKAVGDQLGVKIEYLNAAFGTLIPALQSKRVDMVFSFATVTQEREKTVDFIQYSQSGTALLVQKNNPDAITSLDSLCGKAVGLQSGAVQVPIAQAASAKCVGGGKPAIKINQLGKDSEVQLLLRSGRISADLLDAPVAANAAQVSPDFMVVPNALYAVRPHGIMVLKGNDQLRDVLLKAVQAVMDSGQYKKILESYNSLNLAIDAPKINGATN
jgi:polar amino acid transport system substrate-binding protein